MAVVNSIMRTGATYTSATSVQFRVTFDEAVNGVTASAFALAGDVAGDIQTPQLVSPGVYTVTVANIVGEGELKLNLLSGAVTAADDGAGVPAFSGGFPYQIDHTAPTFVDVEVPTPYTYSLADDQFSIYLNFDEDVVVDTSGGSPRVAINVGGQARFAQYNASESTDNQLAFTYQVLAGDNDDDGVEFGALDLNNAVIKDKAGNVAAPFTLGVVPATPEVKVDTAAPTVVSTTAPSDGVYIPGDELVFTITFSEIVTADYARLGVQIGDRLVKADYFDGSGTDTLSFHYFVQAGDVDADGVVVATAVDVSPANIEDAARNAPDFTGMTFDTSELEVDGVGPRVVSITRLDPDNSFATTVRWQVVFDEPVVDDMGSYDFYTENTGTLDGDWGDVETSGDRTTWTVTLTDITGSGTVKLGFGPRSTYPRDAHGNVSDEDFTNGETYTLNSTAAKVASVSVPADKVYHAGESMDFVVHMDKVVTVTGGTPRFALILGQGQGGDVVYANFVSATDSGGGTDLLFRYVVTNGRLDTDGVSFGLNGLDLRGAVIRGEDNVNAEMDFNNIADTSQVRVDAVAPAMTANVGPSVGYYSEGATLTFTVKYDETVIVDTTGGTPYIDLHMPTGGSVRAYLVGGSNSDTLTFSYTVPDGVQSSPTGVSISSMIFVNGGTIKDAAGNNAATTGLTFSGAGVVVDAVEPGVQSIVRAGPTASVNSSSVSYTVTFGEAVAGVDASDFTVTKTGSLAGGTVSVTPVSDTVYTVTVSGLTGEGEVRLDLKDAATIKDLAGNDIADGFEAGQSYTVDASAPGVASVAVPDDGVYTTDDVLTFTVTLNEAVTVTTAGGTPRLAVTIGSQTVYAVYSSADSSATELVFKAVVPAGAADADGISLGAAIDLQGGVIKDAAGNNLDPTLNAVEPTGDITVDTSNPTVTSVGAPAAKVYGVGDHLDFTVTYSETVTVDTTGGSPTIDVTLNTGGVVKAEFVSLTGGNVMTFRYVVEAGDLDTDGVVAGASIALNGATIKDSSGLNATLSGLNFTGLSGVKVDGVAPTVASIARIGAASTNAASVQYAVTFDEAVQDLDVDAFTLTATGTAAGVVRSITGSGTTWTVTVDTVSGDGTLRLDLDASAAGVTDLAGNAITGDFTAGQAFTIDHTPPAAPVIALVAGDDKIGADEVSGLTLSGTTEAGSTIRLSIGGAMRVITATGTAWSYAVTADDLRAMGAGDETLSVTAIDAAGNVSAAGTRDIVVDAAAVPPPPSGGGGQPQQPSLDDLVERPVDDVVKLILNATNIDPQSAKINAVGTTAYGVAQDVKAAFSDYQSGVISLEQLQERLTNAVLPTTGVAHDVYKFFVTTPSAAGMSWLIDSPDNPNDLTDAYYAPFSLENRYINFAVNLGKVGEGKAAFEAKYGAMSFSEAVSTAYGEVIGFSQAQSAGLNVESALSYIASQQRYFEALGGDQLGAKAAMVGYVISAGSTYHVGRYFDALQDHVVDTILDSASASSAPAWDLI